MRLPALRETLWEINVTDDGLQLNLVRKAFGNRRVLRTSLIADFESAPESERTSKLLAVLGKRFKWVPAYLTLPRDRGIVRQLRLPSDIERDLASALALQIESISAWPENEVYWAYASAPATDNPKLLEVVIGIIPRSILDPWLKLFDSIDMPLSSATLQEVPVNVVPTRLRSGIVRLQAAVTYLLAAGAVVAGLAFLVRDPYQQRVYAAQIEQEIHKLEPEMKEVLRRESELESLSSRYQVLKAGLEQKDSNIDALKALATILPSDTFVLSYRYQNESVTILGMASSALDTQSTLEKSATFKDVQFSAPITRDTSGKDRFALKMLIEANP